MKTVMFGRRGRGRWDKIVSTSYESRPSGDGNGRALAQQMISLGA
jgi:hypothetical protein